MRLIIVGLAERKLGHVLAIGIAAAILVAAVPSSAASNRTGGAVPGASAEELLEKKDNVVASRIPDREAILGSIKEFLGTGK